MQVSSSTSSSEVLTETKNKGVGRFFRNGLIMLVVIFAFDQAVGYFLHYIYFRQKTGPNAETTFVFTKMHADGIILGSSRGRRNYDTHIFADSLGISMYNAGHDGQSVFYEQAVIRTALSRYDPKIVIIDLNPEEMYFRDLHYDRLNVLAPYYRDFAQIRDIYLLKGVRNRDTTGIGYKLWPFNNEKIKMISAIYPYNSYFIDILTGIFQNRKSEAGFMALKGTITQQKAEELIRENNKLRDEKNKHVDPNKIGALANIISLLTSRGCKVVVSMSPALQPFDQEPSYIAIKNVCDQYGAVFRDYSQDLQYRTLNDFFDNHMNKTGADIFSASLSHDIKTSFYPGIFTGNNGSVQTSNGNAKPNNENGEKKGKQKKDKNQ